MSYADISHKTNTIVQTSIATPLGPMVAAATPRGICLLEFEDRRMLPTQYKRLKQYFMSDIVDGDSSFFIQLTQELQEYFEEKRSTFTVPLDRSGTPFQHLVWDKLQNIPYGQTRAYQDIAIAIQKPTGSRAVARANGDNKIAIIIPCHRVIGKDGSMVGYGGKVWRKKYLLELEGAIPSTKTGTESPTKQ